jgi:hypothetical protein
MEKKIREDGLTNLIDFVKFMRGKEYVKKKDIEIYGYGSNKTIWRYMQKLKKFGVEFDSDIGRFGNGIKLIEKNRLSENEIKLIEKLLKNRKYIDSEEILKKIHIMNDKVF